MGRDNGGGIALLFVFCGLDAIGRAPGGQLIAGVLGCLLFVGGMIGFVVWVSTTDFDVASPPPAPLPPGAMYASPPPPAGYASAQGEKHTPTDTSTESWWTNFILIFIFISLLTTPACWYVPQYMYGPRRTTVPPVVQGTPVSAAPTAETAETAERDLRPLLAFRVEGETGGGSV